MIHRLRWIWSRFLTVGGIIISTEEGKGRISPRVWFLIGGIMTNSCFLLFSWSVVSDSFATTWTVAHQVPLSMEFPRQEHWSGLPFPSPGDLPDPGTEPVSPALVGRFFTIEPPGKSSNKLLIIIMFVSIELEMCLLF